MDTKLEKRIVRNAFNDLQVNMLNRAEYSNGKDLRNKYIHSTYPMDEDVQMQDYMDLLKIMIIIIGKINEEFLIKCTKSDENNQ